MPEIPALLNELLRAAGPTGAEAPAAAVFTAAVQDIADVRRDPLGSVMARLAGDPERPAVALFAHIDEIGLIVTDIEESGMLAVEGLGGWDPQILVGQRLTVLGDGGPLPGVIGRKAVHLQTKDDGPGVTPLKQLRLDIGARDREQASEWVSIGDAAVIAAEPVLLPNGRLVSRALDNRTSVWAVVEVLRRLAASDAPHGDVIAVASVQEEVSSSGAISSAYALDPAVAIVVDVTHASDAPGMSGAKRELGSGPAIVRGPGAHPDPTAALRAAAASAGIAYTLEALGGRTLTDADGIFKTRAGIPTAVIGFPLRYMHSPVEMVQLSDVEATIDLLVAYLTA